MRINDFSIFIFILIFIFYFFALFDKNDKDFSSMKTFREISANKRRKIQRENEEILKKILTKNGEIGSKNEEIDTKIGSKKVTQNVIYNRVGKCGSTTTEHIFENLSKSNKFKNAFHFNKTDKHQLTVEMIKSITKELQNYNSRKFGKIIGKKV